MLAKSGSWNQRMEWWLPRAGSKGNRETFFSGFRVSIRQVEEVLEISCRAQCLQLTRHLKFALLKKYIVYFKIHYEDRCHVSVLTQNTQTKNVNKHKEIFGGDKCKYV